MESRLIICILISWTIHGAVFSLKYQHIGDCYHFHHINFNKCNLTLVCDDKPDQSIILTSRRVKCSKDAYQFYSNYIGKVNFEDCQQPRIPVNMFNFYYRVHTLDMSDMNMTTELLKFLAKATPLLNINLSHNAIDKTPEDMFGDSKRLAKVDFSFNRINRFDSNAFSVDNRLKVLNLSFNNIRKLTVKTFQRLKMLQHLFLSNNRIAEVPSFLFHKTVELIEIDLSCNAIRAINNYAFSGEPNMKKLNLSRNHLTTFNKKIFETQSGLMHLDVSHNQIRILKAETFVNVMKLQFLNVSHNKLSEIEVGSFSTLMNLQELDLSANDLKKLNTNVLPPWPHQLKSISIADNQLQELSITSEDIPKAKIVGIYTNKFNCSQKKQIFQQLTEKHVDSFSTQMNCSSKSEEIGSVSTQTSRTHATLAFTSASGLPSTSTSATESTIEVALDRSTEKMEVSKENELPAKNKNIPENLNYFSANVDRSASGKTDHLAWFIAICLVCLASIASTLLWLVLQKRRKLRREQAFHRRFHYSPADEIVNGVENRVYELLNKK